MEEKMLKLGIEPKTFALLARRSNQLSYSSTALHSSSRQLCFGMPPENRSRIVFLEQTR